MTYDLRLGGLLQHHLSGASAISHRRPIDMAVLSGGPSRCTGVHRLVVWLCHGMSRTSLANFPTKGYTGTQVPRAPTRFVRPESLDSNRSHPSPLVLQHPGAFSIASVAWHSNAATTDVQPNFARSPGSVSLYRNARKRTTESGGNYRAAGSRDFDIKSNDMKSYYAHASVRYDIVLPDAP